ncbi:unnamed protein product [Cyprideis torosa]|uniref:Uncharacterized protein n=1 Tax=Cyprideis torosa TaxID=163714 RepID=A0A7R8ZWR3_9CRUS|nr:unnamed protein product [Cyprideis torosa]CAG0905763.1 unnamed protein product [Cyprideis torosa]
MSKTNTIIPVSQNKEMAASTTVLRRSHLKRQELVHSGDKPWSCELGSKYYASPKELEVHLRTHTGEEP